ncbi:ABC-type hemin transport system, periplasmic component [Roseovarius mucosus DSM 17069]|uniref:ABC-type hemin transport system, periplasmic component n=1 Tax=Roseovarius mucosus DSM 17069 TaxID=1288298 RepID=A0A0A0HTR1_9RHOB|nr:ABC transporter substrate-binding protein [Roseovarius mucosus]KGM90009.1 ABC-type hemin transport system, periplasmic component [Roseovarius mucosus DSM 17069]
MSGITLTRRVLLAQVALLALAGASLAQEADRVLSIGGSVTEIVHALGQEHRLVARDTTSTFPPKATELPDVGYARALSPEGVLSVAPSLILAIEGAGPPEAIEVLAQSGVTYVNIPEAQSAEGILAKIIAVGAALGVPDRAEVLATETRGALETAAERTAQVPEGARKRVLFILSLQGGRILASGRDTQAAAIIEMAGGINAVTGFDGYKQMTDEAVAEAAPDVILMMDRTGDHAILDEQLFALPSIRVTPAGATESIVRMNGLYLLGFGPRTAKAALELNTALYPQPHGADDDRDPS